MAAPAGRYQRLRALASGGMGTVYLGRSVGAGGFERLVAIKVMHPHLASDPQFVKMFLDEARLAASIRHPNVVAVLDVETSDDGVSLVMDYVDGQSLHQLVKALEDTGDRLPIEVALRIVVDALGGLHAAHELEGPGGISLELVHRDVSPQNILIGADGVTRITDFGVAHAHSRLADTQSGQMKGKLGYMSVEQLRTQKVDRRADVYSAGVVLWELLAGVRLFTGESDAAIAMAAAAGPVQSPHDVDERVPQAIDDVCMRALCKAAEDRWPTAAAFAEALEDAAVAGGVRLAKTRDVAQLIQRLDEDGPTRLKPQAAEEWMAKIAAAGVGKAKKSLPSEPSSGAAASSPGSAASVPRGGPPAAATRAEATGSLDVARDSAAELETMVIEQPTAQLAHAPLSRGTQPMMRAVDPRPPPHGERASPPAAPYGNLHRPAVSSAFPGPGSFTPPAADAPSTWPSGSHGAGLAASRPPTAAPAPARLGTLVAAIIVTLLLATAVVWVIPVSAVRPLPSVAAPEPTVALGASATPTGTTSLIAPAPASGASNIPLADAGLPAVDAGPAGTPASRAGLAAVDAGTAETPASGAGRPARRPDKSEIEGPSKDKTFAPREL